MCIVLLLQGSTGRVRQRRAVPTLKRNSAARIEMPGRHRRRLPLTSARWTAAPGRPTIEGERYHGAGVWTGWSGAV